MPMPRTVGAVPQQAIEKKPEARVTPKAPKRAAKFPRRNRRKENQAHSPRRHSVTGARNLAVPSGPSIQIINVERESPNEPPLNPRLLRSAHRPSNPEGSRIHS